MLQKDYFEVAHHHDTEDNYNKDIFYLKHLVQKVLDDMLPEIYNFRRRCRRTTHNWMDSKGALKIIQGLWNCCEPSCK